MATFLTKMPEDDLYEIPLKDGKIDFDVAMEDIMTSLQNASRKDLSQHDSIQGATTKELPPLQTQAGRRGTIGGKGGALSKSLNAGMGGGNFMTQE